MPCQRGINRGQNTHFIGYNYIMVSIVPIKPHLSVLILFNSCQTMSRYAHRYLFSIHILFGDSGSFIDPDLDGDPSNYSDSSRKKYTGLHFIHC